MIRYLTAGESHGKGLTVIIDGVPANLSIKNSDIDYYLGERQKGYGRGGRQKIEKDRAEILSGIRAGKTTGSPISVFIKNKDFETWKNIMSVEPVPASRAGKEFTVPRPGHADLAGGMKFNQKDLRNVLERASARETAARVVAGAIAKKILSEFGIEILGYVVSIGGIGDDECMSKPVKSVMKAMRLTQLKYRSDIRCPDSKNADLMIKKINEAAKEGDTLGGVVKVISSPLPAGLGDYTQWDKKLDAKIAAALMSIQAVKGVEFGAGFVYTEGHGSDFHDEIFYSRSKGYSRKTNNAGGFEGGVTNGEPLSVRAAVKPISTVKKGMQSVNIKTKKKVKTVYERSDICAVPSASLIAEAVTAVELAGALQEKLGGDEIAFMKSNYKNYRSYLKKF